MSRFRGNTPAVWYVKTGNNIAGESIYAAGVPVTIAVIKMLDLVTPSPVRSEASASRGKVDEEMGQAVLLLPITATVKIYDRVDVAGYTLEITGVFPRYDIAGAPEHYRVTAKNLAV